MRGLMKKAPTIWMLPLIVASMVWVNSVHAADGDFSIFREATAADTTTTSVTNIDWDTTVSAAGSIAIQGGNIDIDLSDGGHYLVMYSINYTAASDRKEVQTWIRNQTAGSNFQYGRGHGFGRNSGGADSAYANGAAIIDVSAGDDIRIQAQRTDSEVGNLTRRADKSGIAILKLDDSWDYILTRPTSNQGFDSTTFADVTLGADDEIDSGSFSRSSGEITLKSAGHYIVTYNLSVQEGSSNVRTNTEARLILDGTEIDGTRSTGYMRADDSTEDGAIVWAGIIETSSSNQVLELQVRRESSVSDTGLTTIAAESGITIVKIPDFADYIRLGETGGGQNLSTTRSVVTWDEELEEDTDAFSHDTSTNSERVEIDANGDYLFFSSMYASRSSGSSREEPFLEWRNSSSSASGTDGGGLYLYGSHGNYNRGAQGGEDAFTSGSSGGIIMEGLLSSQYIELTQINEATDDTATYQADRIGLQGVELGSLFATDPLTNQLHYRWRNDTTDLNTSGGFLAAEDTAITAITSGTTLRARIEVANTGTGAEAAARTYELEWGELSTTCAAISTWTGVADSADEFDMVATTHITPDGESTTSGLLANTESYTRINGEGRESADTTGSLGPLSASNYTELEYSFQPTASTTDGTTYCFRLYDTTAGSALDQYSAYPTLTMASENTTQLHFRWRNDTTDLNTSGGFLAAEDSNAIGDLSRNSAVRIRLEVANEGDKAEDAARTYELEFAEKVTTCAAISSWTGVGDTANDAFDMVATTHIDPDGESTTAGLLANGEGYTRINGEGRDTADTTGSLGPLSVDNYTELEFSLEATDNAVTGSTYCFRLYDSTAASALDTYSVYPEVTIASSGSPSSIVMEWGTIGSIDDGGFTTLNFENAYTSPVFMCTVEYSDNTGAGESDGTPDSVVCRVDNLGSTSADLALQEAGGSATAGNLANAETVHYLVIEAGDYETSDIKIEAFTYNSTVTDNSGSWTGQSQSYTQTYMNPVVLSQVQTYNDTDWSVAYAYGSALASAPDASNLVVGKHVAQDTDTTRSNETVGVVVIEQNNGSLNGEEFEARLQTQTIDRIDDAASTTYTFNTAFSSAPSVAIIGQSGVSGTDGPHPVLSGATPLSTTDIELAIMEDEIVDTEQAGNTEFVSYFVLEGGSSTGQAFDQISYRFYQHIDAIQPTTALAAENTTIVTTDNRPIRIRMDVQVGGADLPASGKAFKLQFRESSDCTAAGAWTDVGGLAGSEDFIGLDNSTPADGATITTSLLNGGTNDLQSYEEVNNSVNNPTAISKGDRGEWDWVVKANDATVGSDYCFRMVQSDGTELQYTRYPQVLIRSRNVIRSD